MNAQSVHVIRVNVGQRRRTVDRQKVKGLADSISEIGLLNPITIREVGDEYMLVAGRHRLEAAKQLGWSQIPAVIVELDDVDRMLAEIDENLIRNDLNDLERSEHLAERKRLYLLKHPETKRGTAGANAKHGSASETVSFAADTAAKTDRTERAIQQDVQIAESIPDDVRDAIRETTLADSKTDLLEIARLPAEQQREVVETADLNSKASVRQAIAERKPSTERKSVSSNGAQSSDFEPAPEYDESQDPGDQAFNVSNEPHRGGPAEQWCQDCNGKYRGATCPCKLVTEPEPVGDGGGYQQPTVAEFVHPKPAAPSQPAARTSSTGLGKPSVQSATYSGPPPLTIQGDAADALRAVADRYAIDRLGAGLPEAFDSQQLRSLAVAAIDALPADMLAPVAHRLSVRVKTAEPATEPASTEPPSSAVVGDWVKAAQMCMTPGSRLLFAGELLYLPDQEKQRRAMFARLKNEFEPLSPAELLAGKRVS